MIQVKIFQEHYVGMLERAVNEWLMTQDGKIEVINITSTTVGESKLMSISYKIKEQENEKETEERDRERL